jgi:hypothetical protein
VFEENLLDVGFDGALGDEQAGGDRPVRESLGDQGEDLALALAELVERIGPALAGEQPGDDRGVDDGLPVSEGAAGGRRARAGRLSSASSARSVTLAW